MLLNVHSQYSLRYGTMTIAELIAGAKQHGIRQLFLTDINNSTGVLEFIRECSKEDTGIKPGAGIEFRRGNKLLFIGIARNREGMRELNDFLTHHNLNQLELPDRPWDFLHATVIYPFHPERTIFKSNEYMGVRISDLPSLYGKDLSAIREHLVVHHPVTVNGRMEYRLHEYLRAIDLNKVISQIEDDDKCLANESFITADELCRLYADYPFLVENTEQLMQSCEMDYQLKTKQNRKTYTGSSAEDELMLNALAFKGMEERYGLENTEARDRIEKELKVISELNFCAYFLITWDVIQYSHGKGYYHVGRGSGANSIIAYCLRITDVDPIELNLYFERFLNKQRSSPPDFDIDYSWDEREDVQNYIFNKYKDGHRVALLGTMTTFRDKSIIREIGKVMGLPKVEIDGFSDPSRYIQNRDNETFKRIMVAYDMMQDMPNQRSIHAGGIVISEEPITYYSALDLPPKGMPTVQWDMYEAEVIGYDKYDILSQRGIGHIKEAVRLIEENKQEKINIHEVKAFMKDTVINNRLKTGNTIGCFYIESPAMRQLLAKLRCEDYLTLVAASSIIRPGVAQSGMMKAYIHSYHHPDEVKYLHPIMEQELKETFGIMVYQEDVIKICYHYGGLELADADVLRRGMSGKYRSREEFDKLIEQFFLKAKENGHDEATTQEVWRQVSSFAGYSFSKAHSASFAVESYQSLFLKTYFPKEFMVAVLNNYGGFYSRWVYVHELKLTGADVQLPCVNKSDSKVTIKGDIAHLGLIGIQGLESRFMELIPAERERNGDYQNLEDFVRRTGITLEQSILLIRIGALRFTGRTKKELLWEIYNYLGNKIPKAPSAELFAVGSKTIVLPEMDTSKLEDAYNELELLGFPVSLNMFDLLKTSFRGEIMAAELTSHIGKTVRMVGQYVCEKTVHTKNKKKMWFGTFIDADGKFFDTTHFATHTPVYPFRGTGCYLLQGKVVAEYDFPSIEVLQFAKLPIQNNPVSV